MSFKVGEFAYSLRHGVVVIESINEHEPHGGLIVSYGDDQDNPHTAAFDTDGKYFFRDAFPILITLEEAVKRGYVTEESLNVPNN